MLDYAFKPLLQSIKDNHCTQVLVPGVGETVGVQGKKVESLATWTGYYMSTVFAVTVLPDGTVVSGSHDKTLRHWDPQTGQCLNTWWGHTDNVNAVTVLPDGTVVSGSYDETLRHWDPQTGQCLNTWRGHTDAVSAVTVLSDGTVVSGSSDYTLRHWDPQTGQCLNAWTGHTSWVRAVTVLPDGTVVSGSNDDTLRHWDPQTGQCLNTWTGHTNYVNAVTVLPDGSVVSGSTDYTLRHWDPQTGQCLNTWKGHTDAVFAVTVLPDGFVVSGSHDNTLRHWDPQTGQCLNTWTGHTNTVWVVTVLPDGTVVSGSWDGTLRHWDPQTGQCLNTWRGHTSWVRAVTVLPDGTVVSGGGGGDNTLRHWPRVGPTLTEAQFSEVLSALAANTSVHTLSVKDGVFSNTVFESLFHVLKTHPTLNTLVLDNCEMGDDTVAKLLLFIEEGVRDYHTLPKRVSFEGNPGLGFVKNQYALAQAYFTGVAGLVKNVKESARWFMEPAAQGYVEAQYRLGVCYKEGQGLVQNIKKAHECFMEAAKQGYVMAYWHLGLLFSTGIGVALSDNTAQGWFTKGRPQALPDINELLAFSGEKSVFHQEQGLTVYHLMALMGDRRWYEALAALSTEEKAAYGLEEGTVLAKDRQGLRASELGAQQLKFLAEDRGLKLFSAEAQDDPVLQGYSQCVKQLRQGEEEAKLAVVLRAQQGQARSRLNYSERSGALLKEIDALRGTEQCELVGESVAQTYSVLLQQLWQWRGALIKRYFELKGRSPWPSGFDPRDILSPSQVITQWTREGVVVPKRLQLNVMYKGLIAYVVYEEGRLKGYYKEYMKELRNSDTEKDSDNHHDEGSFLGVLNAYKAYIELWYRLEKGKDKAQRDVQKTYLLTTPTLLLQSGCAPAFVNDRIPQGSTLSPAQKLPHFLDTNSPDGPRIEGMVGVGTAPVFPIQGVHYKRTPHAPGVEYMVSSLGNVLAGEGATPTVLLKVIGADGMPYAYQASHTVQGKDLQSVILHHSDCIDKIRSDNFSAVAVLGMLTDPQDGKPDNYMVEFAVDGQGGISQIDILGIDNDIAFSDVVIKSDIKKKGHPQEGQKGQFINIKNVIYFFPQMMQPIDAGFRDTFLKREPEFILMEWLRGLQEKNKEYATLLEEGIFTESEYSGDGSTSKRGLQLPIKVVPGTIRTLYRKLCQMNNILKANPTITLWELLMTVEPEVGMHYAKVKAQHPHATLGCDPMACITTLYEENISNGRELMWFRAQLDAGFTHTMTSVVLKTAEEFGFEDNRTATLDSCLWKLLTVLQYERFTGVLAPVLYESMTELVKQFSPQTPLLDGLLSHGCYSAVYWLWTEQLIERETIQTRCDTLKKYSLLHFWVEGKHEEGVKQLLSDSVCSVDSTLDRLLSHGCYSGLYWLWTEELVDRERLKRRCEDLKKYSLLHFFSQGRHEEGVKALLRGKVYAIDVANSQGYTPLHIAASVADKEIVRLLLKYGADKEATTTLGKTPLAMAESRAKQASNPSKYEGVIGILKGVNVDASNKNKPASEAVVLEGSVDNAIGGKSVSSMGPR